MFTLFSLPITVSGSPVANGSLVFTLVGGPATIISTGGAAPSSYTFNLDANGNPPAVMQMWGNQELTPAGTNYTYAVYSGQNGTGTTVYGPFTSIVGPSAPYAGTLYPSLSVLPLLSFSAINGVNVSGTPSNGQVLTATGPTAATWQNITVSGTGMVFNGSTSGSTTVKASAVASGTLTLPAATDTLVGRATTDTLSNKTLSSPSITGTITGPGLFSDIIKSTGNASLPTAGGASVQWAGGFASPVSGRFVFGDGSGWQMLFSKRLASVTTDLFTFQDNGNFTATGSLTATSINKVAVTAPATSATLTIANGKTLTANNSLTLAGTDSTTQTFPASPPTGGVLSYGGPNKQIFTSSGTFTIPTGVTAVKATVVAAGGAGGGAQSAFGASGTGGGSGGCGIKWLTGLTPGNTITVTVGTGGTGVTNGTGNAGTASSISSGTQTITTVSTNAGGGGGANNNVQAGAAAAGTGGDFNFGGGQGGWGNSNNVGGPGSNSIFGGGGGGGLAGAGGAGNAYGAGGGGAGGGAGTTQPGGAGANGVVIFEWVS